MHSTDYQRGYNDGTADASEALGAFPAAMVLLIGIVIGVLIWGPLLRLLHRL